eukprot:scaffold462001_cov48-Prasinocladus_malaysianus.AAC.3
MACQPHQINQHRLGSSHNEKTTRLTATQHKRSRCGFFRQRAEHRALRGKGLRMVAIVALLAALGIIADFAIVTLPAAGPSERVEADVLVAGGGHLRGGGAAGVGRGQHLVQAGKLG